MRLWKTLAWRIVFMSLFLGVVALVLSGTVASRMALETWANHMGNIVASELRRDGPTACINRPIVENGTRVVAYDATTLQPATVGVSPLRRADVESILGDRKTGVRLAWMTDPAVEILVRTEVPGPCGIYQITWPRDRMNRLFGLGYMFLLSIIPIMIIGAGGTVSVVRPLVRRIARQRVAAAAIGTETFGPLDDVDGDELGELGNSINLVHDRVVADARALVDRQTALEQHLSNVAHDLRTPIAALQLSVEAAASLANNQEQKDLLTDALSETVYLTSLVENLWIACELSDGLDPHHGNPVCDLVATVQQIEARFRLLARRKEVSVEVAYPDHPVMVRCRALMAQQAVSNLVQNALQHAPSGSHVVVVLDSHHRGRFELVVLDDGPGVKPHELPRLAERAFRANDARSRHPTGGGLGLAITREVCQQFGFELEFANAEPRGLSVTIRGSIV